MITRLTNLSEEPSLFLEEDRITFSDYLKSIPLEDKESDKYKLAREKLDHAGRMSQVIKKNSPVEKKEKSKPIDRNEAAELLLSGKNLSVNPYTVDSNLNSSNKNEEFEEKLKKYLANAANERKKEEFIYGYKEWDPSTDLSWGQERASETENFYIRHTNSTITKEIEEWVEFGISYDNKLFLIPRHENNQKNGSTFSPETMSDGTFLKAAGRLRLRENQPLYIQNKNSSSENLSPGNLAITLFVLKKMGFPISSESISIMDDKGNPYDGSALYYADEKFFPSAKAIAENKKFSVEKRLSEVFLKIDDTILSTKKENLIKTFNVKRAELKADIVDFLLMAVRTELSKVEKGFITEQSGKENNLPNLGEGSSTNKEDAQHDGIEINFPSLEKGEKASKKNGEASKAVSQNTSQLNKKINDDIENFKSKSIDFQFVKHELLNWYLFLSDLRFQAYSKLELNESEKDNEALVELKKIKADLIKIKETPFILPQRFAVEPDGTVPNFIRFYNRDPITTCIALLDDYTKGGFWKRLFSGAWRRNHIKSVEQFLKDYKSKQFPDDLSIQIIYQEVFGVNTPLEEHQGKKGTLFERLNYCSKLANETKNQSHQALIDTSSYQTNEKAESEGELEKVAETVLLTRTTTESYTNEKAESESELEKVVETVPSTGTTTESYQKNEKAESESEFEKIAEMVPSTRTTTESYQASETAESERGLEKVAETPSVRKKSLPLKIPSVSSENSLAFVKTPFFNETETGISEKQDSPRSSPKLSSFK